MGIVRFMVFLLILFGSADLHAREGFSWEMYLQAMTNRCTPDHLERCRTRETCVSRGGYWYDNSCHREPGPICSIDRPDLCTTEEDCTAVGGFWYDGACHAEPLGCGATHPELCLTEQECLGAGGYWYEKKCNAAQSPNAVNTAKLAGEWYFVMNIADPSQQFNRTYAMDGTTVKEDPAGSGIFTIAGTDSEGDPISGKYDPVDNNFLLAVTKPGAADILYEFVFTAPGNISGCYYEVNEEDGSLGPCVPMQGETL